MLWFNIYGMWWFLDSLNCCLAQFIGMIFLFSSLTDRPVWKRLLSGTDTHETCGHAPLTSPTPQGMLTTTYGCTLKIRWLSCWLGHSKMFLLAGSAWSPRVSMEMIVIFLYSYLVITAEWPLFKILTAEPWVRVLLVGWAAGLAALFYLLVLCSSSLDGRFDSVFTHIFRLYIDCFLTAILGSLRGMLGEWECSSGDLMAAVKAVP